MKKARSRPACYNVIPYQYCRIQTFPSLALYCKHPIWCIKPGFASWLWFWLYLSCLLLNPVYPKTGISLMIWSLQVITSGNFTPAPYGPSLDREYKDGYVSGCRKQIWSTFLYKKDMLLPSKGSKSCNSVFKDRGKGGGIGKTSLHLIAAENNEN